MSDFDEDEELHEEYLIEDDPEDPEGNDGIDLFSVKVKFVAKDFVTQRNGKLVVTDVIVCGDVDHFLRKIWEHVSRNVKREVRLKDTVAEEYEWCTNYPERSDIESFVSFQGFNNKRSYGPDRINTTMLQSWTTIPEVTCYIFIYGKLISTKQAFSKLQKQLIHPEEMDRAGAASNLILFDIMKRLKEYHCNLKATDQSWLRWANYITSSRSPNQDELIKELPPSNIIQLFSQTRSNAQQQLEYIHRSVRIGQSVNNGIEETVKILLVDITDMQEEAERHLSRIKRVKLTVEALNSQTNNTNNLLEGFGQAVGPQEDEFGTSLFEQIDDVEDTDHIE